MATAKSLTAGTEIAALLDSLDLAAESGAWYYVELGVYRAGTSIQILRRLKALGNRAHFLGVDVDPRAGMFWRRQTRGVKFGSAVTHSFEQSTTEYAALCPRPPLAWVFVDACHCRECTVADATAWGSKLVVGGILAIHDTRLRKFKKLSQHGGTRLFGGYHACEEMEAEGGFLSPPAFEKIQDIEEPNGLRIYRREAA